MANPNTAGLPASQPRAGGPADTREAILDAAERLFSEHGFAASSLRAITRLAGVNLAAVNYHFGSKEGLVRAVFARRIGPLSAERLRLLTAAEEAGGADLRAILRAFVTPFVALHPHCSEAFRRLMGRVYTEPTPELGAIVRQELAESVRRFVAALSRCLPELPSEEVLWRFFFSVGAMAHTLAAGQLLEIHSEGRCTLADSDLLIERLVTFLAAGFRADGELPRAVATRPSTSDPAIVESEPR